jgi:chromosomal replication initiator protein
MVWVTSDYNRMAVNTMQVYDPQNAPFLTLLYGPSGLGKTELLRSCFLRLKKQHHVNYIDAQDFVKRFSFAAQEGGLTQFREKIRSTPLLIFDHLEKLKGKKHSIEEFLHTYETLFERGAKMIVGFQGKITDLDFLGEKLYSRLLGGLAIPILSPTETELLDFLSRYSRSRYLIMEEKILEYISSQVKNFREGEEFLQGFVRYADSTDEALDMEIFLRYVPIREKENKRLPTPDNIIRKVAEITNVEVTQVYGDLRGATIREARQLAMYGIRKLCMLSYPDIGRYFNKAHSAIIKSCQQFENRMKSDPVWEEKYNQLLLFFRS